VHDPDEYLAAAKTPDERQHRFANVLGAYRALFELKRAALVCRRRHRLERLARHPRDCRASAARLGDVRVQPDGVFASAGVAGVHRRSCMRAGVGMINSAVFNAGFLTGGAWFDYRKPDPGEGRSVVRVARQVPRDLQKICAPSPPMLCVQFGLALPGVVSVALNTGKPERIAENVASATNEIPATLWRALKDEGLVAKDFPIGLG
jgi:D-threo-aldose 1-dehydrogenase